MEFHAIIPARYASVRLPGKALRLLAGKPMVQHVYERAEQSGAASVTVATDDQRIADAVEKFGGAVCMTDAKHHSGTERIAEAVTLLKLPQDALVVNVQGDEPLIPPQIIQQVARNLAQNKEAAMATLCAPIIESADVFNSNVVKVLRDHQDFALYFSRAPMPWNRDLFQDQQRNIPDVEQHYFRHIGIYAYRVNFIHEYLAWTPSPFEHIECLEQLRTLWHGKKIHVALAEAIPPQDINSEEDLQAVLKLLEQE